MLKGFKHGLDNLFICRVDAPPNLKCTRTNKLRFDLTEEDLSANLRQWYPDDWDVCLARKTHREISNEIGNSLSLFCGKLSLFNPLDLVILANNQLPWKLEKRKQERTTSRLKTAVNRCVCFCKSFCRNTLPRSSASTVNRSRFDMMPMTCLRERQSRSAITQNNIQPVLGQCYIRPLFKRIRHKTKDQI